MKAHRKPKGQKKFVRINDKTIIEVSKDIPDNEARERFLKNHNLNAPKNWQAGREDNFFLKEY